MTNYIRLVALSAPLFVMGCGGEKVATQEEVCAAAVAAQIGVAAGELMATRKGTSPAGNAVIQVQANEATYDCELDASMEVVDIRGGEATGAPG